MYVAAVITLQYEGLRELAQALHEVNVGLYEALLAGLREVGEVIRGESARRFLDYGASEGREASFARGADGLGVLVRPNTSRMAIVSVAQTVRRSGDLGARRSNFGDLMMRKALIPARRDGLDEAAALLDSEVADLLHEHGF
jgi:hypothetical protein